MLRKGDNPKLGDGSNHNMTRIHHESNMLKVILTFPRTPPCEVYAFLYINFHVHHL